MYYVVTPWKVFGDFSFNQLALFAICCLLHDLKYCILFQHVRPTDNIIAVVLGITRRSLAAVLLSSAFALLGFIALQHVEVLFFSSESSK